MLCINYDHFRFASLEANRLGIPFLLHKKAYERADFKHDYELPVLEQEDVTSFYTYLYKRHIQKGKLNSSLNFILAKGVGLFVKEKLKDPLAISNVMKHNFAF
tara:strand:- start:1739 stop:2047 length:309 start_codon:yes stop_codon:yes gene_type:complete